MKGENMNRKHRKLSLDLAEYKAAGTRRTEGRRFVKRARARLERRLGRATATVAD